MTINQQTQQSAQTRAQMASYSTEGALALRLTVTELLQNIERDLRGEIIRVVENEKGQLVTERQDVGETKANDKGIQAIMKFLRGVINTAGVQGNFNEEQYNNFLCDNRMLLTKRLFINMNEYEIDELDIDDIIDDCMNLAELVVSRTINNLERESYSQTIRHSETATLEQKKGVLPI